MDIAVVETGGDPGHAPARALYESAGFALLRVARYFRLLDKIADSDSEGPDEGRASDLGSLRAASSRTG
jgi:hypothetical protein